MKRQGENGHQSFTQSSRKIDSQDIALPPGYHIEAFATGLTTPINIIFINGEMFVADSGVATGNGKFLRQTSTGFEVVADGFNPPLTGINYHDGLIYVSHRGYVTTINLDGNKTDIIADFAVRAEEGHHGYIPGSGVIWKVRQRVS